MKALRALIAIGGFAATLAMGSMVDMAQAADKSSVEMAALAKKPKPAPFPTILVLCRPYQTCPP